MIKISNNTFQRMVIESLSSVMDKDNSCHVNLEEGRLDDVYGSENFQRWFNGSKIVDENGRPKLLGHATRNFGFNKFNTPFIHLAPINDASYFSGGNKRMFKYKNTLDKLSPNELVGIYNKYFSYDEKLHVLDNDTKERIEKSYQDEITELNSPEEQEELKSFGIDVCKEIEIIKNAHELYHNIISKYNGTIYFKEYRNGLPRISPSSLNISDVKNKNDRGYNYWLKNTFLTLKQIKQYIITHMFYKDNYLGKGGTYALCAKVLNPLYVDCKGNSWNSIYITPQTCCAYNDIFAKYEELGYNDKHYHIGTSLNLDNEGIAYLARQLGYDGVVFKNIREGALGDTFMNETYIVFSTKQLKSPFENNGEFGNIEHMFK